jgi:putative addiction module killer protein
MKTFRSNEFAKWLNSQPAKSRVQIEARLLRVEEHGHLGTHKYLVGHLWELKFNNGNRIYYTIKKIGTETMFLILGGNKNGQQKDINKAAKVAEEIHAEEIKNR